jgi:hypothetical protein
MNTRCLKIFEVLFVNTSPIHVPWNLFLPLYVLPTFLVGFFLPIF